MRAALAAGMTAVALAGCAGTRIDNGVFHARSGYRVAVPGPDWRIDEDDRRADLALRHREAPAAMAVTASCDPQVVRRSPELLERHLLLGLRDRTVIERNEAPLNGGRARHEVVEGRMRQSQGRVRVEAYTMRDERCLYDVLYVADPEVFDAHRPAFQRFVDTFAME
jgi:hypothetical protein